MKKMMKISALALSGMLLAACGAEDDAETSTGAEENSNEQVELRVFIAQPRFREQYENFLNQFQEDYLEETGIQVDYQLEMPGPNESPEILQTRLSSNDSPDVFTLHALRDMPVYQQAGYLEDLSDEPFVENTLDAPLDAVTIDGSVYGAPLESLYWGYLYNQDIFDEHNLEVPTTISEMEEVVNTLNDNGVTPFVRSYQQRDIPQLFLPLTVGAVAETEHDNFYESMNSGEASLGDIDNFFTMMDLSDANGTDRPFEVDGDRGSNMFANEEAAMWVQGPWYAETILASNEDMNFSVAPLPVNEDPEATMINSSVSTSLAVSNTSENKEVAKDLVNYFLESEQSNDFFESVLFNPVTENHDFEIFPWLEEAMVIVEEGQFYQDPPIPNAVKSESERVFQEYLAGSVDQEFVIESLDRVWEQSVD